MQTRTQSAVETSTQTITGLLLNLAAGQWLVYPLFGIRPSLLVNIEMTLLFTVVSIVRGYLIRRLFNRVYR